MLFALLLAGACSLAFGVALFNNTGEAIEVNWDREGTPIAPNRFFKFVYYNGLRHREFELSAGGCEYLYDIPLQIRDYDFNTFDRGVQVQVEKDFSINLLPVDYKGEIPASSSLFLQREGFPLHPVSRTCR